MKKDILKIIEEQKSGKLSIREACYEICSMCSQVEDKKVDQALSKIMDIACELELPAEHREQSLGRWNDLISYAEALKD